VQPGQCRFTSQQRKTQQKRWFFDNVTTHAMVEINDENNEAIVPTKTALHKPEKSE